MTQNILITGAAGMIGKNLVDSLHKAGENVIALSRADVDLRDASSTIELFKSIKPDLIYHLAARVAGIGGNIADPYGMYLDNILINTNVIEAGRQAGVGRIVAAGTAAIYSDNVTLPISEDQIWWGAPHTSERPYGNAKRAMLAQLEALKEAEGIEYSYAILTNIYGPHDCFDTRYGHVVPSLLRKFLTAVQDSSAVEVWGTGIATRDFLYVGDAVKALQLLAKHPSGAINVATGSNIAIRDVVEIIKEISGLTGGVLWDHSKPEGQLKRSYNVDKLNALGFAVETDLRAGLSASFKWLMDNEASARN